MVLCDTNIFIEIYKGNLLVIDTFTKIGQSNVAISDVTCAELLYGARNKIELELIKRDINKLFILPISSAISSHAINLIEQYTLSHNLNLPDSLIASTAIIHNIKLYTLNLKDFRFLEEIALFKV
ncbi:type II toxin-antitoxin system VapC family toxin [Pedobacter sp. GR22-10]|uniref:type II toxin-antitoxin system VapC family toxin n=1 Tax=Pedobacter sp. GR22-10 TaxID=2994472 RepID=UPI002246C1D3|nr:type II toxin-antitoxin system VapC family toxin [Pedobacter sp. GR22-10]MCX2430064.1 type II toxin-antitoxin system VapC family toxin [Pedobacter sp. GR22-10]